MNKMLSICRCTCWVLKRLLDDQLKRRRRAEEVQSERENKKRGAYTALASNVYAIRMLINQPEEWTVAQTKTMTKWWYCKQVGNLPFPTTKQFLLTRYHEIMIHDNSAVMVATVMAPTSSPFSRSHYMTRYDVRTTSLTRTMQCPLLRKFWGVFDRTEDKIIWEHRQSKNDATTAKKCKRYNVFKLSLIIIYMYGKILINGFEPQTSTGFVTFRMIDFCKCMFK